MRGRFNWEKQMEMGTLEVSKSKGMLSNIEDYLKITKETDREKKEHQIIILLESLKMDSKCLELLKSMELCMKDSLKIINIMERENWYCQMQAVLM